MPNSCIDLSLVLSWLSIYQCITLKVDGNYAGIVVMWKNSSISIYSFAHSSNIPMAIFSVMGWYLAVNGGVVGSGNSVVWTGVWNGPLDYCVVDWIVQLYVVTIINTVIYRALLAVPPHKQHR